MARSPVAAARLKAVSEAKRVHRALDLQSRVTEADGQIDIFDAISELDITLLFKPLTSALGFCLPEPLRGILVTTRRTLHIQRFTAAHELGHVILSHSPRVDTDLILTRNPYASGSMDIQEAQAEAFAAEFLLPRWLYIHHARKQGWGSGHLRNPDVVYQLSLRMGASYKATCWGLSGHSLLPQSDVNSLAEATVSKLKVAAESRFKPGHSHADVWKLTEKDGGSRISGNPDDLIRFDLEEASDAGYTWNISDLEKAGYEILSDESEFSRDPLVYGAPSTRVVVARPSAARVTDVALQEVRPWAPNMGSPPLNLQLRLEGKENSGLSRNDLRRRGLPVA